MSDQASPTRFIRLPEVLARVPLSRTRVYELMREGRFPKCVKLSQRAIAWNASHVEQWLAERSAASMQPHKAAA